MLMEAWDRIEAFANESYTDSVVILLGRLIAALEEKAPMPRHLWTRTSMTSSG